MGTASKQCASVDRAGVEASMDEHDQRCTCLSCQAEQQAHDGFSMNAAPQQAALVTVAFVAGSVSLAPCWL